MGKIRDDAGRLEIRKRHADQESRWLVPAPETISISVPQTPLRSLARGLYADLKAEKTSPIGTTQGRAGRFAKHSQFECWANLVQGLFFALLVMARHSRFFEESRTNDPPKSRCSTDRRYQSISDLPDHARSGDLGSWLASNQNKVKAGQLPRPSPLTPGSNREGWLGQQILDHRRDMQALAEQKAATDAARPKQSQPKAFQKKVKKTKLHTTPSQLRSRKSQSQSA
jgi:hypothetical protein